MKILLVLMMLTVLMALTVLFPELVVVLLFLVVLLLFLVLAMTFESLTLPVLVITAAVPSPPSLKVNQPGKVRAVMVDPPGPSESGVVIEYE